MEDQDPVSAHMPKVVMVTMIIENDDHGKPAYVNSGKLVIKRQDN